MLYFSVRVTVYFYRVRLVASVVNELAHFETCVKCCVGEALF